MLFTKSLFVAAMAIIGASASPQRPRPQPKTGPVNVQNIQCSGGAQPYCCSPANSPAGGLLQTGDQSQGSTCSKFDGSVQCNANVICCNNNGAEALQLCAAGLKGPIVFV